MQTFNPRLYLAPVRDEEAESQRKARSRHVRQTRRSTQGVTLTELKEAQRTYSVSPGDGPEEDGDRSRLRRGSTEPTGTMMKTPQEHSQKHSKMDEQGNVEPRLGCQAEYPTAVLSSASYCGLPRPSRMTNYYCGAAEEWLADENQNPLEDFHLPLATDQLVQPCYEEKGFDNKTTQHDRVSRLDSGGGDGIADKPLGRTSSYTRRETRLAALNKQEDDDCSTKDFKKMYEEAVHENEKLKSRLQNSKQELAKIRSQLEKVSQKQDRISERSTVLESEKREKQALEKRVSDMEEELKVLTELRSDNQRMKDENGALIRVISKLSK